MTPRPYRLGKRQEVVDETRLRIVEAARKLLKGDAYASFTVETVAREADVSRATVYYQFGSKSGLLEALFDDLNAPEALAALFTFVNRGNAELDRGRGSGDMASVGRARAAFARIDSVLDLVPDRTVEDPELARFVEERIGARKAATGSA